MNMRLSFYLFASPTNHILNSYRRRDTVCNHNVSVYAHDTTSSHRFVIHFVNVVIFNTTFTCNRLK